MMTRSAPPALTTRGALAIPILTALSEGGTLAVLRRVEGRFSRKAGALMGFDMQGQRKGELSGGCIEADLAHHAANLPQGGATQIRYGDGSPYVDLRLPCGAGIDVLLQSVTAPEVTQALTDLAARQPVDFALSDGCTLRILPRLRIAIFGQGQAAEMLAALGIAAGAEVARDPAPGWIDRWTAVTLLHHDIERERPDLTQALASPAYWIGALGSADTNRRRIAGLDAQARTAAAGRLHGPMGLIKATRDPQMLAVSVLAALLQAQP